MVVPVQLNDVATQVKSKFNNVMTKIKRPDDDQINDPTNNNNYNTTNNNEHQSSPSKVVDVVINTLFGACTSSSPTNDATFLSTLCSSPNSTNDKSHHLSTEAVLKVKSQKLYKTNKHNSNHHQKSSSLSSSCDHSQSSNLESKYAQYYQDDHGRAARAVLMASQREELDKKRKKEYWNEMDRLARVEASNGIKRSVMERRMQRRNSMNSSMMSGVNENGLKNNGDDIMYPTQQRRIQGELKQYPILQHYPPSPSHNNNHDEDSESGVSYNFDDGISALSAHTLEEMAKLESIMQQKQKQEKQQQQQQHVNRKSRSRHKPEEEPKEEGFDIQLESTLDRLEKFNITTTTEGGMGVPIAAPVPVGPNVEPGVEEILTFSVGNNSSKCLRSSNHSDSNPPSPVGTENSGSNSGYSRSSHTSRSGSQSATSFHHYPSQQKQYPIQMARNSSLIEEHQQQEQQQQQQQRQRLSLSHSPQSPNNNIQFSERWRASNEQQYWSQLVEVDDHDKGSPSFKQVCRKRKTVFWKSICIPFLLILDYTIR